ncbi:ommochrome-binding protein isoform X1 [Spodoptera frugiperda]|uniref:Ommochrome-binding protein isoform X1 n=1 Tax=Spodoptera frugiperda TaxID=7108 RepID=A0A9R0EL18_SPOFR|nr:ommochrome-binding protein isoform X1 [Spodoptera frugiperda]
MGFLKLLVLLAGAPFLAAAPVENQTDQVVMCDGVIFHDVYYDKELLFTELGRPYNLVMHKFSGMLFFSHTIQNGTQVDFGIRSCHLEKKTCREIQGVPGGYAVAYDGGNDDIYFGGHDGIYKYNFLTKAAEFFAEEGKSIWGLFVRRNFYYIEYPTQKLFVYQDDSFVQVAEAINIEVDHFFVSKHIDVYFANKTALYKVDRPNNEAVVLNDEIVIRQIVEDSYGDVYFCAGDGIYLEDKPYHKLKKIAEIDQAFGMSFDDKDRLIYSDKDTIYRLNPSKYSGLCLNAIINPEDRNDESLRKTLTR